MILTQPVVSNRNFGYGFKPKQNIPESQKSKEWCNQNADWCIAMSPLWWKNKADEQYSLYNGKRTSSQYEHLTKTYGVEFPAGKIKHIPLIRPLLNRLLSEAEERIFEFSAHSEDADSVDEKIRMVSNRILKEVFELIKSENDPEKALEKIQRYYREEYQSEMEIDVQRYLDQYMLKHRMDREFSAGFLDKMVTGMHYFRVNVNRIGEDPEFKLIKPGMLFYADNDVRWVSECDWAVHPTLMTPTEILDKFGEAMTSEDVAKVESWIDMYSRDAFSYRLQSPSEADNLISSDSASSLVNSVVNHKIAVYDVEWKSIRTLNIMKSPNKYAEDAPFIKILSNESLEELYPSRKNRVTKGYVQDLYRTVRIGEDIYIRQGRVKYASRSMSSPSKVFLTFEGLTFNGRVKPYSLIEETKDLQDLYDIMHYHKENLIALSGVRGSYMDLSQLPDFGTGNPADNIKMFLYYKKMGTAFIDRSKEGADKQFNQFPTYDETLGAGMKAVIDMILHLEEVAGRIVGVNRQQLGATQYFDGKATTQMAMQNSAMVTEVMFNEQDEFVERALTAIANASRVAHKNGHSGYFTDRNRVKQMFYLDDIHFPYSDWGIHITNKTADKRSIMELKAMAQALMKEGLMQVENILPLYKQTSLAEITREIEVSVVRRRQEIEQQQQQIATLEMQVKQAREKAEIDKLTAQVQELMSKVVRNKQEMELENAALQNDAAFNEGKLSNDGKRIELEAKQLDYASKEKAAKSAEIRNK